jgi:8-oxo-dGTP pyrophosphatase MutT (NUDIX family)/inorganic pyrophosphatase
MKFVEKGDKSCLGKEYTVKIDRPVGAYHPKHPEIIYPVNYGYVEGLIAGDEEDQDVYVLGVDGFIAEIRVKIVAVIERSDDNEDKWVGVPPELAGSPVCYECNIKNAVHFQEQFHESTCDALYEKTCGAIMYTEDGGVRKYLLIKNDSGHIGFPKGHVEYGETEEETAVREVYEETGLKAVPEKDFRMTYSYENAAGHHKTTVYFLSHYSGGVHIQQEEISESYILPYDEALEKLNFPQDRLLLEEAEKTLNL